MALSGLTPRQETAQRLTRELQSLGATVTSVLPLEEGKNLRFWVSDYKKKEVVQQLADAGYEPPIFLGMSPQMCTATYSMGLVNNFELPIPAARQPIVDDRAIPKDDVGKRVRDFEVTKMLEAIYGKRR